MAKVLFHPKQVVTTVGVDTSVPCGEYMSALVRHCAGDWGDVSPKTQRANDRALQRGGRLMSIYQLPCGETIWIITEADRSVTTILLPEEY